MSKNGSNDYLVDELKIDKDLHVNNDWINEYARTIVQICGTHGIKVNRIKMCKSRRKGFHLYIPISPAIDPCFANKLQFLLGDDAQRVAFNQARIQSDLIEFNKLFEKESTRLRIIYRDGDEC